MLHKQQKFDNTNLTKSIETITRRTRNLRKSLHKIQKQFDNQAITKFFQKKLKETNATEIDVDNDENACDAFTTTSSDDDDKTTDDDAVKVQQAFSSYNFNHDIDHQSFNGDVDIINVDQNSNGSCISSHNSIQPTNNIFLQKPVLHLNIDKSSLNQAASIVINKHLEKCPNFATTTTFTPFNGTNGQTAFNTANQEMIESMDESKIVQSSNESSPQKKKCDKPKLRKQMPRKCANKLYSDSGLLEAMNNSDSNSCDSGVVSDRSFELNSDANKPTTPHRIVCPSSTPTKGVTPKIPAPKLPMNKMMVAKSRVRPNRNG